MACIASGQYGGQSINVAHLAPFVDVSRQKIRKQVEEELSEINYTRTNSTIDKLVEKRVRDDIKKGVQTMQYQINTLNTSNGQSPFVSLFMYLNDRSIESERERDDLALVIDEILAQRYQGTKDESGTYVSPAFPKLIYVLDENNIEPGSKYYYLTELAAKCTAKRLVPDYISAKVMKELKGDVYSPMGCRSFLTPDRWSKKLGNIGNWNNFDKYVGNANFSRLTYSNN